MKKTLAGCGVWVAVVLGGYVVFRIPYSPCDTPLAYRIGAVDSKFKLNDTQVSRDVAEAAGIWNKTEGKTVLAAEPGARLTVNFVYDERSALDTQIAQQQGHLQQQNTSLQQQIADYQAQVKAFQAKVAAFNATVAKYNQAGGAPPDVYQQLVKEQVQLNAEGAALNTRAKGLNLNSVDYNSQVQSLNSEVNQFNQEIAQRPEEGLYDEGKDTITIYFASNPTELVHTLAHEFGHALGMGHVSDPTAIMYAYTTQQLAVTAQDAQELAFVCRERPLPVKWFRAFRRWVLDHNLQGGSGG